MAFWNKYPYTDFHELNLDWILATIQKLDYEVNNFTKNFRTPEVVYTAYEMTNKNRIYLYMGNESGYHTYYWYYFDRVNNTWTPGGLFGSAIVDADFSNESVNALENKTITNYLNVTNKKDYSTLFCADDVVQYAKTVYTPELFGAVGDGVTDDSTAIKDCIEKAIEDGATVAMYNNYRIANPIVINADSKKCNILVYGYIKAEAQTTISGIVNSNILIKLKDGGLGNTNNACINIYAGGYNKFSLFANDVNGLAYQMGGSNASGTMTNFNKAEVYGWNNMQTLRHGDGNNKQWAFGTYANIYDYKPTSPIQFLKSNDITILHVENLFEDDTHNKNSIEFDECDLINIESLAIGGTGKYLGYINDSRIHINYLFVNSEDSSSNRTTEGLFITGKSVVHIDFTTSGNVPHAVIVDTLTNKPGANWRPQVYMKNGFVYNPSTDKLIDTSNANSQRVGCFDEQIPLTKVHANISSFSGGYIRIGRMVFINMKMTLSAQIPSGSLQILFNGLPPHDSSLGMDISVSSSAQMFSSSKLGESATSLYLPAGQALSAGDNYIIGSYVAAY